MKAGDIVFFREAANGIGPGSVTGKFQGHGFGILMGTVKPFAQAPKEKHLVTILGTLGFIALDDIVSFLGEEACKTVIEKFKMKYSGQPMKPQILSPPQDSA